MKRSLVTTLVLLLLVGGGVGVQWFFGRYQTSREMVVPVEEASRLDYPADPGNRSLQYAQYRGRELHLQKRDATHFDFVFKPTQEDSGVATVRVPEVDMSLFVPQVPEHVQANEGLSLIAMIDREWNRQQVRFEPRHFQVEGGDGWENLNLSRVDIARNCLNAGLFEVILYDDDGKSYYHGWFTFPMGHYRDLVDHLNPFSYWRYWWQLEHWDDPSGTEIDLDQLRTVLSQQDIEADFLAMERIFASGGQARKLRTTEVSNARTWGDFFDGREVKFATFAPPGKYRHEKKWGNEYERIAEFRGAKLRTIKSPAAPDRDLQEIALIFESADGQERNSMIVSGVDLDSLPQLRPRQYPLGFKKPMGIGVGPFYQSYGSLQANPPHESPYFSVLVNDQDEWIDHHTLSMDGPVMHLDHRDPSKLHLYLLSYERHTLVGHFLLELPQ